MGFTFWPKFFSPQEQRVLLAAALFKLDATDDIQTRRRRRIWAKNLAESPIMTPELFYPDESYDFQEGHYDQVIRRYREMHLAGWPTADFDGLTGVLHRLHSLCPTSNTQTHLLHLASDGEILPHIDNVSASGSWIMGVSLGAERLLRLESIDKTDSFEVLLTPGSIYLQRSEISSHATRN
ncbi:hypothetical protein BD779DRAFT_1434806 [Infundibulicybe gibba]|nr:hypothetical protein BD779DRAFT_1434806 [Infundibulicybe gibba]